MVENPFKVAPGWFTTENDIFDNITLAMPSRMVYIYLCRRAGEDGESWPSVDRIAYDCDMSRRTVQRALKDLQKKRLLTIEHRYNASGDQTSNLFTILSVAGRKKDTPWGGVTKSPGGVSQSHPGGVTKSPEVLPDEVLPKKNEEGTTPPTDTEKGPSPVDDPLRSGPVYSTELQQLAFRVLGGLGPTQVVLLDEMIALFGQGVTCEVLHEADRYAVRNKTRYAERVSQDWAYRGIKSVADLDAYRASRDAKPKPRQTQRRETLAEQVERLRREGKIPYDPN